MAYLDPDFLKDMRPSESIQRRLDKVERDHMLDLVAQMGLPPGWGEAMVPTLDEMRQRREWIEKHGAET